MAEILVTIGDLVLVRRRSKWVNATVKAINANASRVLAAYVDTGEVATHSILDVYIQQPGFSVAKTDE